MAFSAVFPSLCSALLHSSVCYRKNRALALSHSPLLSSTSFLRLKKQTILPNKPIYAKPSSTPTVFAAQSNFLKVLQTAWNVGKDGIEAGTNLVPDFIPRPVARVSVAIVALSISLFVLKSVLSTAFFVLGTMGLAYFIFIALNKDQAPRGGRRTDSTEGPLEDPVEEARRIMEKYK